LFYFFKKKGLNLFPDETEQSESPKCLLHDTLNELIVKEFCHDHCSLEFLELITKKCYQSDTNEKIKSDSLVHDSDDYTTKKNSDMSLNSEGLLFYYRQFVYNFLQEISYNEHINNDTTNFKINIFILGTN